MTVADSLVEIMECTNICWFLSWLVFELAHTGVACSNSVPHISSCVVLCLPPLQDALCIIDVSMSRVSCKNRFDFPCLMSLYIISNYNL
jgi:hypothetical protein